MRLLCDANIGKRLSEILTGAGHDVLRSIHRLPQHAPDIDVLALAVHEQRILITCDADFGGLVFRDRRHAPPAIIYVRFEPDEVEEIAPRVIAALETSDIEGHIVVIGEVNNRTTKFPGRS